MTDPMELAARLEKEASKAGMLLCDPPKPSPIMAILTEAAACIRELVEEKRAMQVRLDRWEPKMISDPSVSRAVFITRLFDGSATLPPAPGAEA